MKNLMKHVSTILLMILIIINLSAQQEPASIDVCELMQSAATIDSELLWDKAVKQAKQAYATSNASDDLLHLCYAYYGTLTNCMSTRNETKGEKIIKLGLAATEKLSKDKAYASTAYALMSGFNGMAIAFSPMKGMFLGPKSDKQVEKALKLDPENAIAWLQKGSSQFNTPKMFGGSVSKSIESFKKSIAFFDKDASKPQWIKIESMTWLGQAYHSIKDYKKAETVYNSVLKLSPGYAWVEQSLLPATRAKMNQQ